MGAALAIPAKLRLFNWLKRYQECGNPCQKCAQDCPVEAIFPEGNINENGMYSVPELPGAVS